MGRGSRRGGSGPGRRAGGGGSAFSPAHAYGSDLLLWLRDNQGVTLSTVGEWKDQSPTGLLFAQATQVNRPAASSGAAVFDDTNDTLTAGTTPYIGATSGITVVSRMKLDAVPGAATYRGQYHLRQAAGTPTLDCASFFTGAAAYRPWTFWSRHLVAPCVGVADALDTNIHTRLWTEDGAGNYTARVDGVAKSVVTSGAASPLTGDVNSVGPFTGVTPLNGTQHALVVYSSVLSAANQAALETLIASSASTYADFAALGTVVCCLLPGAGQSGDVSAVADQGPAGNNFTHATLANQPYFDLDDSVGDLAPSLIFDGTADNLAHADIAALAGIADMTVAFSYRPDALATAAIVAQWGGADNSWKVEARVDGKLRFYTASGGADATNFAETNAACLTASTWGQYCVVKRGATCEIYSAGALVASTVTGAIAATIRDSAATVTLMTDATTYAGTRLDNIVIAKRAATVSEAAALARYRSRSG